MFSWRNKKNIMWIPLLIYSYGARQNPTQHHNQQRLRSAWRSTQYGMGFLVYPSLDSLEAHAISEDSDQTVRMRWLIWVFAGRTCFDVGFVVRWIIILYIKW